MHKQKRRKNSVQEMIGIRKADRSLFADVAAIIDRITKRPCIIKDGSRCDIESTSFEYIVRSCGCDMTAAVKRLTEAFSEQYQTIDASAEIIRAELAHRQPSEAVTVELINKIVSHINLQPDGSVVIVMINGQTLTMEEKENAGKQSA